MDGKGEGCFLQIYNYQSSEGVDFKSKSYLNQVIRQSLLDDNYCRLFRYKPYPVIRYNPLIMDIIFRVPTYGEIKFQPTDFVKENLNNHKRVMQSSQLTDSYQAVFDSVKPLNSVAQQFLIDHPALVDLNWNDIPDPPRIRKDGFLRKRSASEGINTLLTKTEYDTRPSLDKVTMETGPWTFDGSEHVQLSQAHIANWVKGGESSVSLSSDLRAKAIYKKNKNEWESYIIHKVGVLSTDDEKGRINDDLIELNSKYGLSASKKWYYSFLFNFKTQFFDSYEAKDKEHEKLPVSGFMVPAYFTFALGMDFKEGKKFTLLLSPITSKVTIVRDTVNYSADKYIAADGKKTDMLNGLSVVSNFEQQISREIKISTKLDAFYEYLSKGDDADNPRQVQINWEVILDMRINRFLSTRLLTDVKYFTNESKKVQFKENFNIAFRYTF
ncbi:MAG: DUF3078 domain-containing protein [Marinilabiliaceae bacterium]|nr:DUF3078 domain-containing protein [Marinilabiliaceae bacterium]